MIRRHGPERSSSSDTDKIMFEIFRLLGASRYFRVVYFTELDDHDRNAGINQALAGGA